MKRSSLRRKNFALLRHLPKGGSYAQKSPYFITQTHSLDLVLLVSIVILSLFGLLMVYDASQFEAFQSFGNKYYYIKQQVFSFIIGLVFLGFFSFFDYHKLRKIALPIFLFSLFLLLLVFVPGLGVKAYGAHRWLSLSGFTLQPSEIIKLSFIVFFAALFQNRVRLAPFLLVLGFVTFILGLMQKDLGSTIVFSMIAFGVYLVAGAPIKHFLGLFFLGLLGIISLILIAPYRMKRVVAFLDPFVDPQGFSYHILQVLIALGSGGLFGLGVGQSRQKYAYIPEVTTDSIFSIIGEEFGFLGSSILIALFALMIIRGFKIAQNAPDTFGRLLAAGLIIWLGAQIIVNLAAMVSLMPLTGVPLPFISYGGSALVANLVAVGILLNISKYTNLKS